MRVVIFGASGRTGGELIRQARASGHEVVATTRRPEAIRPGDGLSVAVADATDAAAVDAAVAGGDVVVSTLGAQYTRKPVTVYSAGTANIVAAMKTHGVRRLIVAGTAALDPGYRASDSMFFTRVMEPLFMRLPGRTVYADNRRMEALIQASGLDWTIVRAGWLFTSAGVSGYQVIEGTIHGMFTARADLAACLLAQAADDRYVDKAIGVITTTGTPGLVRQIWNEGVKKRP